MVENPPPPSGPILPTEDRFTFVGCVVLLTPALMVASAAFAPTSRGIWIFCAFLLPPIPFYVIRHVERRTTGYRLSTTAAVQFALGVLAILGSFLLPYAFIGLDEAFLWWLWASLGAVFLAGMLLGLARHDPDEHRRIISRYYRPRNGRLEFDFKKAGGYGMRESTGSYAIDILLKGLWIFYSTIIIIGMIVGGAAAFILIDLFEGVLMMPPEMDVRVMIIELIALIGLGPLGMIMPALLFRWREIARLEKAHG